MPTKITTIQDSLKREYSEAEYNRMIAQVRCDAGYDPEFLAYMAYDRMIGLPTRLFACASLGG